MHQIVLLLGGNIGETEKIFDSARKYIDQEIGNISLSSSIYESEPWGFSHKNNFLNQVVVCHSHFNAQTVLDICLQIEKYHGRERFEIQGYQARTLDIDILFFDSEIIDTDTLTIPHPHLHNRLFTLIPLSEILPDFIHPLLNKTILELKKELSPL